jgi:hypothetical protein
LRLELWRFVTVFSVQWLFLPRKEPMNTFRTRHGRRVAARAHRLDPRQESRFSLALVLLMGLATLSVMATTQMLTAQSPDTIPHSFQQ